MPGRNTRRTDLGVGFFIERKRKEMLLPQRPYMVLGSLREQLLYPQIDEQVGDTELTDVLKRVNLATEGGLSEATITPPFLDIDMPVYNSYKL